MIALIEASRAGVCGPSTWLRNAGAGVVVGVVALPLAMAFAIASGARPEQGIYTAIVGGVLVSLLGGSRLQIAGPTGAFVAILAAVTAKYGIGGLQVATLMAGVMLVLMGVARMGGVIKFIPAPVIVGFTAGIGVIIFVGQWTAFLGLPKETSEQFHQKVWHLLSEMPQANPATVAIGLLSLATAVFAPRVRGLRRIPAPLLAVVVATAVQAFWRLPGVATLNSAYGGIPFGLPAFHALDLSLSQAIPLLAPAFTIAMLGSIESLLSAVVADGMSGTKHDSNQELVGQGIANIVAPLFGGFAATGAIARTATSIRNGATNPIAGIVHAVTLVAVLLALAPLAGRIPLASLAAVLFVVAWNMSDARHFAHMLKTSPRADQVILLLTFALTVFADLVVAVNVGVILAILHFLRRMAEVTETKPADAVTVKTALADIGLQALPANVLVYEISGPLFFGAVDNFERALKNTNTQPAALVIRLGLVPFMDITGLEALGDALERFRRDGVPVLLCEANARVAAKLSNAGIHGVEDACRPTDSLADALSIATGQRHAEHASARFPHAATVAVELTPR